MTERNFLPKKGKFIAYSCESKQGVELNQQQLLGKCQFSFGNDLYEAANVFVH